MNKHLWGWRNLWGDPFTCVEIGKVAAQKGKPLCSIPAKTKSQNTRLLVWLPGPPPSPAGGGQVEPPPPPASHCLSCDAWRQCHHLAPCCPVQRGQYGTPGQTGATSRSQEYLFNADYNLHYSQSLAIRGSKERQATTSCTVSQRGHWV